MRIPTLLLTLLALAGLGLRVEAVSIVYAFSGTMTKTLSSPGTVVDLLPGITTNTPFSGEMILNFDVDNGGPGGTTEYILRNSEYFSMSSGGVNFIDTSGGDLSCFEDSAAALTSFTAWSQIQPVIYSSGGATVVDDMLLDLGSGTVNSVANPALHSPLDVVSLAGQTVTFDGAFYPSVNPDTTDFSISGAVGEMHVVAGGGANLVWQNTSTGDRYIWLMNGPTYASSVYLGKVDAAWQIVGTADFNGDGTADLVWQNTTTGDRYLWLMSGTAFGTSVFLGNIAPVWQIVAVGDFNGDGKNDLVLQNTLTGDRSLWLMNGTTVTARVSLGNVDPAWKIVGGGDFDGDGKCDLVWQNSTTGDCYLWLMNGAHFRASVFLANNGNQWQIAGCGDFNVDGKPDLIWQNTTTGDRFIWLMNGTAFASSVYVGTLDPVWQIAN